MDISHLINDLNDAQREAVTLEDRHALILAGAGSGKTKVLVHRIAWLTEVMDFSPYNILAVTFTNKAANEMRGRVSALIGTQSEGLTMGTFHGLAYRILRRHHQEAGLPAEFQILDADDQKRLIKRLIQSMGLDENQWPPKQVQAFINGEKEEGRRSHHIDPGHNPYVIKMLHIYRAYETQCQQAGLVDFSELLLRAHELWLKQPQVLAHYQTRYRHILVDEFQDTNSLQYAWLRVLAGAQGKLFIVGDDDQSIYGWRGAKIENIQRFEDDFSQVKVVRLEQNYRSTGTILKAANALISHNEGRMGKNLWSAGEEGEPISVYEAFSEMDEAEYLCNQIKNWCESGGARSEIAVLYRSNAQSRVVEQSLINAQIPYRVYGGLRFYERAEIKDVLAYLRLMLNRHDDAAFERVHNHPPRGLGAKTVETIRAVAREHELSLWQAAEQALSQGMSARAKGAVEGFLNVILTLEALLETGSLKEVVEKVLDQSGLKMHFEKDRSEQGQSRLENLDELINAVSVFQKKDAQATFDNPFETDNSENASNFNQVASEKPLAEFLAQATLEAGDQQADRWESSVQLMTLHAAKGLEFPLVFMIGLEEGLFPSQKSQEDVYRLEEERRLAYVGLTRAESKLHLTYANRRRMHGNEFYPQPSRFLKELPEECVQLVRRGRSEQGTYGRSYGYASGSKPLAPGSESGYAIGSRVFHTKFGEGVVLATEGAGDHARIQVNFTHAGSKWLVAAFAKLEKL